MKLKLSIEKTMLLATGFTCCLIAVRIIFTDTLTYIFYPWNLFLAAMPMYLSGQIVKQKMLNAKTYALLLIWLLFLPNAPYIITDIFHYRERLPVPKWYDLLIVISAAWNGLIMGLVSLLRVEKFLGDHLAKNKINFVMPVVIALCSFGVYLGRYLRFNSWDVVADADDLIFKVAAHFIHPLQHAMQWSFVVLFFMMLGLMYLTIKQLLQPIVPKLNQ